MFLDYDLSKNINRVDSLSSFNSHKISGRVSKLSTPFPCYVRLYERLSGRLVSQVLSDTNGNYFFDGLSSEFSFFLVAHDPISQYNAVIQDNVVPK